MDSNIDPESEALIRKLHRELNGLTRSTRGSDRVKPSSSHRGGPSKPEPPPPQRTSSEPLPTNPTKRKVGHGRMDTSGSEASSSGSEEKEGRPAKKHRKPDVGASEPRGHKAKPHSPLETNSIDKKEPPPGAVHKRDKVPEQAKPEHRAPAEPVQHAHAAPAQPDPEAPTSSHPGAGAVATFKTPLEAAAAAASALVKDKVKAAGLRGRASEGKRLIKCFHAGVRWGIALAPEALKTRADLATALNDAFAGEILSCGRGDILNIVFLDAEGKVTEFPSIRNSGSRDRSTKWKVSVERAVKIYVRRG